MGYFSKLALQILSLVVLAWFMTQPVAKLFVERPYITEPEIGHTLSAKEVNDFVFLWNKAQKSYIKKYMQSASMRQDGQTSWLFRRWLNLHDWNTARFLYCEHRLNKLMNCVLVRSNYESNKVISEKAGIPLEDIIASQKEQLTDCNFDKDEYDMIANNIAILVQTISKEDKKE